MKHLVKKHVKSAKIKKAVKDVINNAPLDKQKLNEISESKMDGYYALAIYEDEIIQTFKFEKDNNVYLLPEPNPIVIYFDSAILFQKELLKRREKLFSKLSIETLTNFKTVDGDFYWYFSTVTSFITFLFLALEAFVNKSIPADFEYRKEIQNKKTEIYDKIQIQRYIDFIEKIKYVVPQITNKNFTHEFAHKFEVIKSLKKFRDEIIHTKSFEGIKSPNGYQDLFSSSLDFNFEKALIASKDLINFYEPNLIEECDCGKDE